MGAYFVNDLVSGDYDVTFAFVLGAFPAVSFSATYFGIHFLEPAIFIYCSSIKKPMVL